MLAEMIRAEMRASPITAVGGYMAKPAFKKVGKLMDPSEYGAVPLLGLNGLVFVGHGRSNTHAIVNALRATRKAVSGGLLNAIREGIRTSLEGLNK
jgi:glycerol-3-phosphate acyltransferase PlsX